MRLVGMVVLLFTGVPAAQTSRQPPHRKGPDGLSGWTLNYYVPEQEQWLPMQLVIARRGHVLSRFRGEGFVWRWMFLPDGRQVALESGPLHFVMMCLLVNVVSGKELARYDCGNNYVAADAPAWVRQLETRGGYTLLPEKAHR